MDYQVDLWNLISKLKCPLNTSRCREVVDIVYFYD